MGRKIILPKDPRWPACAQEIAALKPEIARLWVGALLSGDYPEADDGYHRIFLRSTTYLQDPNPINFYDPLGVLCDVFMWETGWGEWIQSAGQVSFSFNVGDEQSMYMLPKAVQEWAGIEQGTVFLRGEPVHRIYNPRSDWDWLNFEQIAEMIKEDYIP